MLKNKCTRCGKDVEYTVTIRCNKLEEYKDASVVFINEYWCLDCIRAKILWPASPETKTQRADLSLDKLFKKHSKQVNASPKE